MKCDISEGFSTIGDYAPPCSCVPNPTPDLYRGPAAVDPRHSYKFSVAYELPFLKQQRGFVGHALGGWTVASFFQMYTGHPIDVYNGRTRIRSRTSVPPGGTNPDGSICPISNTNPCTPLILDPNGGPYNTGGEQNL